MERPGSITERLTAVDIMGDGITDTKSISVQQTVLHKFEKKQRKTAKRLELHKRVKEAQEELELDDSTPIDFSLLDREKQTELLESFSPKEGTITCSIDTKFVMWQKITFIHHLTLQLLMMMTLVA